ncbi:MAG: hypothetical protein J6Y24_06525 [Bacteroidales bacterium]|nr:hypothetical protein [Bacteroidales bacterium]
MKKILIIFAAVLSLSICASKQSIAQTVFGAGNLGMNIGFGINDADENVFQPSFNYALDYGLLDGIINGKGSISGGGYLGIAHGSKTNNGQTLKHTAWQIGTRGALHYQFIPNLDTYGCVSVGYLHWDHKWDDGHNSWDGHEFKIFPTAGVRYMFGTCGVYSELSPWNDVALVKLGVTFIF